MPQVVEGIYAQYVDSVIKLAKRPGGVSKPEIMKGLHVTRNVADGLVDKARLRRAKTVGRTDFFKPTKATKGAANAAAQQEETPVTEQQIPTTEEGLLAALVGGEDNKPASTNEKHTGKNRLPMEDQTIMQATTTAPATATPPQPAVSAPTAQQKNASDLDAEIKAIRGAITEAGEKARKAQETYVVQTAHVNALGAKLQRALEARLLLG